jgi:two-component system phosphate regulon response regulator OmpR
MTAMSDQPQSPETAAVTQERPHVLVVDDDARLRELLRRYLADNGFLVATASDAANARAKLLGLRFDVIVLDLMMPGENGLAFAQNLRRSDDVPILMLTAMDAVDDRIAGLESGADDYLVKPFEPRELVLRLNAILRRASPVVVEPVAFGAFVFDPTVGELRQGDVPVSLTAAEVGLLRALTETVGLAISRERLGVISRVAERSVDVQINRLRRKVEPDPRNPRYLVTVRGEGYALRSG